MRPLVHLTCISAGPEKDLPGKDKEHNWLPTPDGPFQLIFRMYRPIDPGIYTGDYTPPAIKRVG